MIDKFILNFGLPVDKQELVKQYLSGNNEASTFKRVPLDKLDEMKALFKVLTGGKPRVMYRGPRYYGSYSTKRCHATHASIYTKYER
jgi:hypothetical protein